MLTKRIISLFISEAPYNFPSGVVWNVLKSYRTFSRCLPEAFTTMQYTDLCGPPTPRL